VYNIILIMRLTMSDNILFNVQNTIEENPRYRFWFWQIGFWFFMSVVGFFTLILWYAQANIGTIGHVVIQAAMGLTCSIFLHQAFTYMSKYSLLLRVLIGLMLVLGTAFLWTMLHMQVFVLLTGFDDVWEEFGGWYFSGIFVFLCWTGLFHGVRYYELHQYEHRIMLRAEANTREEHLKRVRAQSEARDAKLKMLRYQLNPHFLCNTLNAINSLIEIGESGKAQTMTVQLSEFLRYSLDTDPDTKIPLIEEINALNLYLKIEKTRFAERLHINIDIPNDAQSALVPSLLLQPIIENSMKHAIAKNELGGTISIIAAVVHHELVLTLKDTGDNASSPPKHIAQNITQDLVSGKGVGLKNIKQRLSALYNNAYRINAIFEEQGGLTTIIHLPLEHENKVV
jgi:two-component system LytT family sensor kinase